MNGPLHFVYSSVHGGLAAAYTSGALVAEFGAESVLVRLFNPGDDLRQALLIESPLAEAERRRESEALLAVVPDADGPCWAITTTMPTLQAQADLIVRALSATAAARSHRPRMLPPDFDVAYRGWAVGGPLRAAELLLLEDFSHGQPSAAA